MFAVRKRGQSNNIGRPPSDEFGQLLQNSTVIDGELLLKKEQIFYHSKIPDVIGQIHRKVDAHYYWIVLFFELPPPLKFQKIK